jgi:hypothetical protein
VVCVILRRASASAFWATGAATAWVERGESATAATSSQSFTKMALLFVEDRIEAEKNRSQRPKCMYKKKENKKKFFSFSHFSFLHASKDFCRLSW